MVLRTLVRVAGVAALGVAAALGAVAVGTTPVGTTPVRAAAAAAVVESGFRRLRLRRRAVAAAVMVAAVMVAAVIVAAVMVVGNLWIKSWLPQKSVSWPRASTRVGRRALSVIQSMISPSRPNSVPRPTAAGRGFAVACACMSPLLAPLRHAGAV